MHTVPRVYRVSSLVDCIMLAMLWTFQVMLRCTTLMGWDFITMHRCSSSQCAVQQCVVSPICTGMGNCTVFLIFFVRPLTYPPTGDRVAKTEFMYTRIVFCTAAFFACREICGGDVASVLGTSKRAFAGPELEGWLLKVSRFCADGADVMQSCGNADVGLFFVLLSCTSWAAVFCSTQTAEGQIEV